MNNKLNSYLNFFRQKPKYRRTTIVATIGPACENLNTIIALIKKGMNVARLNFSHGNHEQKGAIIKMIREAELVSGKPIAILQDLQGPKLRVGELVGGKPILLKAADKIIITNVPCFGNNKRIYVDYEQLPFEVKVGSAILLADGALTFKVLSVNSEQGEIECEVIHGGELYPRKGVNLPGANLSISALTPKDKTDLAFGVESGVDWIALSFVRTAEEIIYLREQVNELRSKLKNPINSLAPKIIAKIEKPEAVNEIGKIIEAADGIMVARGDLGVEMSLSLVPIVQKEIINLANKSGKPVITATQMLESMINSPVPTRAEASDVANAIFDGSDGVMLSAESAMGDYPLEAVGFLDTIAKEAEASSIFEPTSAESTNSVSEALAISASKIAKTINAKCVVTFTHTGETAANLAKFRCMVPILALCTNDDVSRRLMLHWNINTRKTSVMNNIKEMIIEANNAVKETEFGQPGDAFVLVTGIGRTDLVQVCVVN